MDRGDCALSVDLHRVYRGGDRCAQEQSHTGRFPVPDLAQTIDACDVDACRHRTDCVPWLCDLADVSVTTAYWRTANVGGRSADRTRLQRCAGGFRTDDLARSRCGNCKLASESFGARTARACG